MRPMPGAAHPPLSAFASATIGSSMRSTTTDCWFSWWTLDAAYVIEGRNVPKVAHHPETVGKLH